MPEGTDPSAAGRPAGPAATLDDGTGSDGGGPGAWRTLLLLLLLPVALVGPALLPGRRFLPQAPVGLQPLARDWPEQAARASRDLNYVTADRLFPVLTDQRAIREQVLSGVLPTWAPELGMGLPLFGGTIAGPAYPPNWLALAIEPDRAAGPLAIVTLVLAGLGLWLFLRRLGLPPPACLVGALALEAGGWGIANLHYFMKVAAALWLPWSLWGVEGVLAGRRRAPLALALAVGLSFLAGFPPIALFSLAATALWAVFRLATRVTQVPPVDGGRGRAALRVALSLALGVGIGAWQLLPMAEASRQSLRTGRAVAEMRQQSLPPATALGHVVPDLFGAPDEPVFAGHLPVAWWLTGAGDTDRAMLANPLEWSTYAGAATVLLALVGLVARPRRAAAPAVGILLALGFAQGWPVLRWLYALPGLQLGAPGRVLAVSWVLWPWLAALGVEALLARRPRALGTALTGSFALAAVAFCAWTALEPERWAAQLERTLAARHAIPVEDVRDYVSPADALAAGERLAAALAQLCAWSGALLVAFLSVLFLGRDRAAFAAGPAGWKLAFALLLVAALAAGPELVPLEGLPPHALVLGGAVIAAVLLAWRPRSRPGAPAELAVWLPAALVVLVEGLIASPPHLAPRELGDLPLFPASPEIAAVAEAAGDGRVLRYDDSLSGVAQVMALARPNLLHGYGVADLTPYVVFTPRYPVELLEAVDPESRYRSGASRLSDVALAGSPVLDLARVTCLLSTVPLRHERLEPVLEEPGFCVYRRTGALPPARLVPVARVAADDADAIAELAAGEVDLARETLLAPGTELPSIAEDTGGGTVEVFRPAPHRVDARVDGTGGGWLVFHDTWAPGWKATVDGRDADVVRADHACRAVHVPAGARVVRTWYEPWSLRIGFSLTLLSLALAAWLTRRAKPRSAPA